MAKYDHKAVRAAYPNAVTIRDNVGVFDASNNEITIDDAKVQAEADKIKAAYDAKKYQRDRNLAYPSLGDQLDMQYWDKKNGTTTWVDAIAKVKSDIPKP